jgi:hypothetical protein
MSERTGRNRKRSHSQSGGPGVEEYAREWALKMQEKFDSLLDEVKSMFNQKFDELNAINQSLLAEVASLKSMISENKSVTNANGNTQSYASVTANGLKPAALYSAMLKLKDDEPLIEQKAKNLIWIGVSEKEDDTATKQFDYEMVKEVIESNSNKMLTDELASGKIKVSRINAKNKSDNSKGKGRIPRPVIVELQSKELRDKLLDLIRSKRCSLTKDMPHSYARRDYTVEEMIMDREKRQEAGKLNQDAGKLTWVVRNFELCKLRNPRDLPQKQRSANDAMETDSSAIAEISTPLIH